MARRNRPNPGRGAGLVRLIGGQHRGRRLSIANLDGLRPTGDRQRETLFNWLQFELAGSRVADLYAGTGALGLEASSRGAQRVWLIEQHPQAVAALKAAVGQLQSDADVQTADALDWLKRTEDGPFDGVFVDPPFAAQLWQPTLEALLARPLLRDNAWVYVEAPTNWAPVVPEQFQLSKEKTSGDVVQRLYRYIS
ncbi:16S rRNA (guanine(966)-N(2))-methyltransferase RsmD [Saccharospirillum sp. MSK14-1]|uniref:16S rRNA (guanine(966)-N(2))-methyltransferase RsmD n=1 Tax=Saccharospirillum sp. MSK14-1 TaxID=1897632 RepID=UPI000D3D5050|nr:16S rRNA (guanine(966)-N(2))-methyltransferase RsmD [Saccharospirillum sp. MSK14-1]PTY39054.1 16S rRNA (guanine(966)-N(2))-methyltransferase RsmD [Saccharospirillum sp. MSK14-1]